ncbi:hypothetical protein EYF80_029809 [Liparis tanakae]|uniref:Uncharacterized protein n=1 Tax=Liparis tanakae TaxID=230148 RepID=A0A4Z2H253_9TELE|nr:hypothetical protein EYF80_029809 [Liparis tanakae]
MVLPEGETAEGTAEPDRPRCCHCGSTYSSGAFGYPHHREKLQRSRQQQRLTVADRPTGINSLLE